MTRKNLRLETGFTLLELMIVVGIIGILSAILLKSVGGASDSARAAKCLANMHDLANACHTVAMNSGNYPLAGSIELGTISLQKSSSGATKEQTGWVSWASMGAYRNSPKGHQANSGWFISTYEKDEATRLYALTNGAIWKAISGNASSYRCPLHERFATKKGLQPVWSYVMNSDFGWDTSKGSKTSYVTSMGKSFKTLTKLDRRLLFAELPFNTDLKTDSTMSYSPSISYGTSAGIEYDPTLQYEENEVIGVNHKSGRKWYAHVCFADGHAEKLEIPKNVGQSNLQNLTEWLCEGTDVSYNGSGYEELK